MAGYIGKSQGVTQVDGYNRTEADTEFVNDPNGVITVDGSNVGIGTGSPLTGLYSTVNHISGTSGGIILSSSTSTFGIGSVAGVLQFYDSTNSSERMRIDSAGRVTMPYQPAFTGTYVGNMNSSIIRFDNVAHNIGSHYNTATGIFTAPVAGLYDLRCNVLTAANVSVVYTININGTFSHNKGQEKAYYSGGNYSHVPMHNDVYLQAGDTVWIALQSGSLNANVASSDQYNALSIRLVG